LPYLSFASFNAAYNPVRLMYEKNQLAFNFWYCALQSCAPYGPENTVLIFVLYAIAAQQKLLN